MGGEAGCHKNKLCPQRVSAHPSSNLQVAEGLGVRVINNSQKLSQSYLHNGSLFNFFFYIKIQTDLIQISRKVNKNTPCPKKEAWPNSHLRLRLLVLCINSLSIHFSALKYFL